MEELDEMLDPLEIQRENEEAESAGSSLVVKITYKSKAKTIFAAMLLTIDIVNKSLLEKSIALSHEPDFLKFVNEGSSYAEIYAAVKGKKEDNLIPVETVSDISSKIEGVFTSEVINTLDIYNSKNIDKDKYFNTVKNIKDIIISTFGDENAYITLGVEKVDKNTIENVKNKEPIHATEDIYSDIMRKEKQTISKVAASFVLSPIYGRAIAEIEPGDVVMVIVENSTPLGKKVNEHLQAVDKEEKVTPVPSIVMKKIHEEGKKGITMILKISDGVYSTIEEADPIKIQTYDDEKPSDDKKGASLTLILSIAGASIFAVLAIVIYFLIN